MMGRMTISIHPAVLVPALLLWGAANVVSQPPATQRIPQFENDQVAVWRTTILPKAPLAMHTHDHPRVIVALSGGDMKIVYADGGSQNEHWDTGKAYWLSLEEGKRRHADSNQGDKPIDVMVVELKKAN